MEKLGTYWFSVIMIIGVGYIAYNLIFGPGGIAKSAATGDGGSSTANVVWVIISVGLLSFAAFDIITGGGAGQIATSLGGLFLKVIQGK
jgi:hypothetical protein